MLNYLKKFRFYVKPDLAYWLAGFLMVDLLSFNAHYIPIIRPYLFILVSIIFAYIVLKNLRLGLLIVLAELFIGSHGYLFWFDYGGLNISIRLAIFLILISVSLVRLYQTFSPRRLGQDIKSLTSVLALFIVVFLAALNGLVKQFSFADIFFDVNAYFFLGLILPIYIVSKERNFFNDVFNLLLIASGYLAVKTLLFLYFFTHGAFQFFDVDLYVWLRDARLGEFTPTGTGAYRIFMQSQIYLLMAWWIVLWRSLAKPLWREQKRLAYLGLMASGLLISFSRSNWLGWLISLAAVLGWLLVTKQWTRITRVIGLFGGGALLGFIIVFAALKMPIPKVDGDASFNLIQRLDIATEAAASSRWNLLPPLWDAVNNHLIIGSGFGQSVTYISNDPRVRGLNPTGEYTTTAFEWGYLEQWLKYGLLGLFAYAWIIILIFKGAFKEGRQLKNNGGLVAGLIAVLGVHIGSPYLNHPLGIGLVLILFGAFVLTNIDSHSASDAGDLNVL